MSLLPLWTRWASADLSRARSWLQAAGSLGLAQAARPGNVLGLPTDVGAELTSEAIALPLATLLRIQAGQTSIPLGAQLGALLRNYRLTRRSSSQGTVPSSATSTRRKASDSVVTLSEKLGALTRGTSVTALPYDAFPCSFLASLVLTWDEGGLSGSGRELLSEALAAVMELAGVDDAGNLSGIVAELSGGQGDAWIQGARDYVATTCPNMLQVSEETGGLGSWTVNAGRVIDLQPSGGAAVGSWLDIERQLVPVSTDSGGYVDKLKSAWSGTSNGVKALGLGTLGYGAWKWWRG